MKTKPIIYLTDSFFFFYISLATHCNMPFDFDGWDLDVNATEVNLSSSKITSKVIVDVGTGTGLLALFAAQAGARKVYAIEASDMADKAKLIVAANGFEDIIDVIKGKIEEIDICT